MPLSLTVRKSIRDSTDDLNANLARINAATGKTFTFDVDWEANLAAVEGIDQEQLAPIYHKEVLESVARCFEKAVADPLTKEALIDATSNNKITIKINNSAADYWVYTFPNGDVVLEHRKALCNTSDAAYIDLAKFLPCKAGELPLLIRKNIEENNENKQKYLEEIATATGTGPWTFHADFNAIIPKLDDSKERIGDIYFGEVLQNIAYLLRNKFSSSEIIKDAFNEATPNKTITFETSEKIDNYWTLSIKDGGLLVQHKPSIANTGDVSYYKLERVIPVSGLIDLVAKLDLNEYKSKHDDALQTISSAAGVPFTFDEASLEVFYKASDSSEKERIGNIIYGEVLPNIASNLDNTLKDDMVKEAFLEAATEKKIAIATDQNQSGYWDVKFVNGVLVLSAKMPVCNTGDLSYFKLEKIL